MCRLLTYYFQGVLVPVVLQFQGYCGAVDFVIMRGHRLNHCDVTDVLNSGDFVMPSSGTVLQYLVDGEVVHRTNSDHERESGLTAYNHSLCLPDRKQNLRRAD